MVAGSPRASRGSDLDGLGLPDALTVHRHARESGCLPAIQISKAIDSSSLYFMVFGGVLERCIAQSVSVKRRFKVG